MKSIGVTLQRTYLTKKLRKEALCNIQLSSLIFLEYVTICVTMRSKGIFRNSSTILKAIQDKWVFMKVSKVMRLQPAVLRNADFI